MGKNGNLHGWSKETGPKYLAKLLLIGIVIGFIIGNLGYGRWTQIFLYPLFGVWWLIFGAWILMPTIIISLYIIFK